MDLKTVMINSVQFQVRQRQMVDTRIGKIGQSARSHAEEALGSDHAHAQTLPHPVGAKIVAVLVNRKRWKNAMINLARIVCCYFHVSVSFSETLYDVFYAQAPLPGVGAKIVVVSMITPAKVVCGHFYLPLRLCHICCDKSEFEVSLL